MNTPNQNPQMKGWAESEPRKTLFAFVPVKGPPCLNPECRFPFTNFKSTGLGRKSGGCWLCPKCGQSYEADTSGL